MLIYVAFAPAAIGCMTSETQVRDRCIIEHYSISNKSTHFCKILSLFVLCRGTSPNSSTTSTSSMSSEVSEDESVLGSEDIDTREDAEVSDPDHVLDYGEFVELIATQEESELYAENVARQEEEEETLLSRFSGEENVDNW